MSDILIIQTGGTIDKTYPKSKLGYAFEITEPAVKRVLSRTNPSFHVEYLTACRKDSQDITDDDRKTLVEMINKAHQKRILITHGTDTMIETGAYIAGHNLPKTVVITGAFLPEAFKDSDADFNVGVAIGALQVIDKQGVYIAMNGLINEWSKMSRYENTNMFTNKTS